MKLSIKSIRKISVLGAAVVAAQVLLNPQPALAADEKVVLDLKLPAPTLKGTPEDLPVGPTIEPLSDKPRPAYMIAKGVQNVAAGKTVTSSVKPFTGELNQITDGKKEAFDYDAVEMKKGSQWIQVDLGEAYAIHAVVMWHDHRYIQVMHDVIVQVSDDPEFKNNVQTVFNNDVDNSSGLGVGTDREYFETHEGKIIDAKGSKGRHVRCYTKGGSLSALNCWQELEVYALPATAKTGASITAPATGMLEASALAVAPENEIQAVAMASTEFKSADAAALPSVAQTARAPQPTHPVPAAVNVETTARAEVALEAPATTPAPVTITVPAPVVAGLNWPTAFLAGLMLIVVLGLLYALRRDSHALPRGARAK